MRRAVLTIGGTVAGLAALFSFKTHTASIAAVEPSASPVSATSSAPSGAPSTSSATGTPTLKPSKSKPKTGKSSTAKAKPSKTPSKTPTTTTPATSAPATAPPSTPASSTPTTKKPTPTKSATPSAPATTKSAPSGTFTGSTENTQYGPMEVQITVSAGKITGATELQQPDDSIASNAVSQLNGEVVSAQSAGISAVSGATYTSQGYIGSLQSAIDQAGL